MRIFGEDLHCDNKLRSISQDWERCWFLCEEPFCLKKSKCSLLMSLISLLHMLQTYVSSSSILCSERSIEIAMNKERTSVSSKVSHCQDIQVHRHKGLVHFVNNSLKVIVLSFVTETSVKKDWIFNILANLYTNIFVSGEWIKAIFPWSD